MDRRGFLKSSALSAAAAAGGVAAAAPRRFVLENSNLAWHLEEAPDGLRSRLLENRITGRRFRFGDAREVSLLLSAAGRRIEIPWWHFRFGSNDGAVTPDAEQGFREGYHAAAISAEGWGRARNLSGGQKGRVYGGYGWFRCAFELPEDARGQPIVFTLGGYDQQDWNEHWVYVNGGEIGHRTKRGRWRTPGQYTLNPADETYGRLHFGAGHSNQLAVRTRGYDLHFAGISDKALERYVFRPYLVDQFITVGEPYLRISEFQLREARQEDSGHLVCSMDDSTQGIRAELHYELTGFLRRKWVEIENHGDRERLLLDIELDDFQPGAAASEGGHGEPVFLAGQGFCAVEHPAGINQNVDGRIRLWHCPGRRLAPGEKTRSHGAVVAVSAEGQALDQFHRYLLEHGPRLAKKSVSIFTVFGVNNQWGACPSLTDNEALDVQQVLKGWRRQGLKLDFFTLDTGWPDNSGDLTEFTPTCYPDGPERIVQGVDALGMKFGLWFSVSWGGWSNGSNPAVQASAIPDPGSSGEPPTSPPVGVYRNGYPTGGGIGRQLCLASDRFFGIFRDAILHHVRHNKARLLKFDSGNYYCNSTAHGHLPGKYSTEAMYDRLIEIVARARAIAPDVFVTWYWGIGSPFWALHGDVIFESGLFMEGSGTSWYPTLYYRDSVTLSLDQNIQFCKLIPPLNKDSLGVWLSPIRWGNFMGKERWREALVMDLGRGNLMFPQIWGDAYLLNDDDIRFLTELVALARRNESLLLRPRRTFGDTWRNEPYGYAFFDGAHGLIFANNAHFAPRALRLRLGPELGLAATAETPLRITAHFPESVEVAPEGGGAHRSGMTAEIWMRPFETLMMEVQPSSRNAAPLPHRIAAREVAACGGPVPLQPAPQAPWMALRFADATKFDKAGFRPSMQCFSAALPSIAAGRHILAVSVQLRQGEAEYRHKPFVAEIVQLRARIGEREVQLVPTPDARQFGNTQSAGCSWVVYKLPLGPRQSAKPFEVAVHSYLPPNVEARVEAWIVRQWWRDSTRPQPDGYYGDAPS